MILIFSEITDASTSSVLKWLIKQRKKFLRVNYINEIDSLIFSKRLDQLPQTLSNQISYIWYRRTPGFTNIIDTHRTNSDVDIINFNASNEFSSVIKYLNEEFSKRKYRKIGAHPDELNKLIQFKLALEAKLLVPETYIITELGEIKRLVRKKKKMLVKPHSTQLPIKTENGFFCNLNTLVTKDDISGFPERFPPLMAQVYIEKKYEIRAFFLNGKFYSTAIFSQSNPKTLTDFRNYDNEFPNRNVPFKLPRLVENKLRKFMRLANYNCGSIDLICTPTNDYYFLEVNPFGQFGAFSYTSNYYLEKLIAETL